MIITILLKILYWIIYAISFVLPTWSIYPTGLTNALNYFFTALMKFNVLVPVDTFLVALALLLNFLVYYYTAKIIIGIISLFRGSGEIKI